MERGFSVNKEIITVNQSEKSLTAQRIIFDSVTSKCGVKNIDISKQMLHAIKNAHGKYIEALAEEKKTKEVEKRARDEKKVKQREIEECQKTKTGQRKRSPSVGN